MRVLRQGDIYLTLTKAIPEQVKPWPSLVLAKGELTGHSHQLERGARAKLFQSLQLDPERPGLVLYIEVEQTVRLLHEEHDPITLEPGIYKVWRQREYTPVEIRPVYD